MLNSSRPDKRKNRNAASLAETTNENKSFMPEVYPTYQRVHHRIGCMHTPDVDWRVLLPHTLLIYYKREVV